MSSPVFNFYSSSWVNSQPDFGSYIHSDYSSKIKYKLAVVEKRARLGLSHGVNFDLYTRSDYSSKVKYKFAVLREKYKYNNKVNYKLAVIAKQANSSLSIQLSSNRGKPIVNHQRTEMMRYNQLMSCFAKKGDLTQCYKIFNEIENKGLKPNVFIYAPIFQCYVLKPSISENEVTQLFHAMVQDGVRPNVVIYTTLLNFYARRKNIEKAAKLFKEMTAAGLKPDTMTFNTLFHSYVSESVSTENMQQVLSFFTEMLRLEVEPNAVTYNTLVDVCLFAHEIDLAKSFFSSLNYKSLNQGTLDVHGFSLGGAYLCLLSHLETHKGVSSFRLITGIGYHSKHGEKFVMRRFLMEMIAKNHKNLMCIIDSSKGALIINIKNNIEF